MEKITKIEPKDLKNIRGMLGLTQFQLSALMGTSQSYISKAEKKKDVLSPYHNAFLIMIWKGLLTGLDELGRSAWNVYLQEGLIHAQHFLFNSVIAAYADKKRDEENKENNK